MNDGQRSAEPRFGHSREVALLFDATASLLKTPDPLGFIDELYRQLSELLGVEMYVHFRVSEDESHLKLAASDGIDSQQRESLRRMEFGEAVCGTVADRREPMVLSEVQQSQDPLTQAIRSMGLRAYVCHPLIIDDQLFGTLSFGSRRYDELNQGEVELVRAASNLVALSLARSRADRELREADRHKQEFLAVLSHELRNPLAPLRTGIDSLSCLPDRPELMETLLPMMDRQLSHLTRLVDDLLDVSRVSQGKISLEITPFDLRQPLEAAMEQTCSAIDERGHHLEVELPDGALPIHGDRDRLTQVFANLLSNAARYTEPGGTISVTASRQDDTAVVRVRDTGQGIPPDRIDTLFRLFSQLPEPGNGVKVGGLGIGLALAQRLAQMHGGSIHVTSEGVGRGSEFVVRLPLDRG